MHGSLEKVCPHFSTGRADYFGSTVNRAARLLCAAKPGQILAEAPIMNAVLKEWLGIPSHLPLESPKIKAGALPELETDSVTDPSGRQTSEAWHWSQGTVLVTA